MRPPKIREGIKWRRDQRVSVDANTEESFTQVPCSIITPFLICARKYLASYDHYHEEQGSQMYFGCEVASATAPLLPGA